MAAEARSLSAENEYALVGDFAMLGIFEMAWYLRGYEKLLVDMMINKELAHALFQKILEVRKRAAELCLNEYGEYLDVVQIGDDIATQEGPAFSPALSSPSINSLSHSSARP